MLVPSHLGNSIPHCMSRARDVTACWDIFQPPPVCKPCRSGKRINLSLDTPRLHWPSRHLNLGDYVHPGQVSSSLDHMRSQLLFSSDASGRHSTLFPAVWILYYWILFYYWGFFYAPEIFLFYFIFKFLSCQVAPCPSRSPISPAPASTAKSDHDVSGSFSHHRIKGLFCQSSEWFCSTHQGRH